MEIGEGVGEMIKTSAGTMATGNSQLDENLVGLGTIGTMAGRFGQLMADTLWLDANSPVMTRVTGGVRHFVAPSTRGATAVAGGAVSHAGSMTEAFRQFERILKEQGKTVCRRGEACDHGNDNPENVFHIHESQLVQAMMIALTWAHLHQGADLVNAAVQVLGQLTSNSVPVAVPELLTHSQQYQPEDLLEGYEAEGITGYALDTMRQRNENFITIQVRPDVYITIIKDAPKETYTWIVGPFQGTGVSKEQLLDVIKHILKPEQPGCCIM